MRPLPRILPLVGIAAVGVLAINALAGARSLPDLVHGARAMAEEMIKPATPAKPVKGAKGKSAKPAKTSEGDEAAPSAAEAATDAVSLAPAAKPAPVCAPTAAELAKEAGLSPAELQILQSLGTRRGQLDQREQDLSTQLALMAAAEAKLDAKLKALNGLKSEIQGLMGQSEAKQQSEVDRMVKVFEGMKPKDSAPRMVLLDDSVRLPIAAKMKERALSAMLAQMPPVEAKRLTEALAKRFSNIRSVAAGAEQAALPAAASAKAAAEKPGVSAKAETAAKPDAKPKAAKPKAAKPKAKRKATPKVETPLAGGEVASKPTPKVAADPPKPAAPAAKPG